MLRSIVPALAVLLLAAAPAIAQPQFTTAPMVREGVTQKVSEHVYVIPDGEVPVVPNVGIIVGSKGVLVVDTGLGAKNAEVILREVAKVAPGREIYLVSTHVHPEHDLGAHAFPAATKMLRSKDQQAEIAESGLQTARTFSGWSPLLADLLQGAEFRPAAIAYEKEYVLDLGGVRARIMAMGPNHTWGDTATYVEGDGVLFSGDVVMKGGPNFSSPRSSVKQWLASLDKLQALQPKLIVGAHGPNGGVELIEAYRAYLTQVRDRTAALKAQGQTADQAVATLTEEIKGRPAFSVNGAVRAAYRDAS